MKKNIIILSTLSAFITLNMLTVNASSNQFIMKVNAAEKLIEEDNREIIIEDDGSIVGYELFRSGNICYNIKGNNCIINKVPGSNGNFNADESIPVFEQEMNIKVIDKVYVGNEFNNLKNIISLTVKDGSTLTSKYALDINNFKMDKLYLNGLSKTIFENSVSKTFKEVYIPDNYDASGNNCFSNINAEKWFLGDVNEKGYGYDRGYFKNLYTSGDIYFTGNKTGFPKNANLDEILPRVKTELPKIIYIENISGTKLHSDNVEKITCRDTSSLVETINVDIDDIYLPNGYFSTSGAPDTIRINSKSMHVKEESGLWVIVNTDSLYLHGTYVDLEKDNVSNLYWLDKNSVSSYLKSNNITAKTMIYCYPNSGMETWCKNNGKTYKYLTDDIVNGTMPDIEKNTYLFDMENPDDVKVKISLGTKPAGASGISDVYISNEKLKLGNYEFNNSDTITIKSDYLETLSNGTYAIGVKFNNAVYKSGATITVVGSYNDTNTDKPEALETIKYEFYKDYPDHVIIPVKMNSATDITQIKIGTEIVDPINYDLQDGAIILSKDYLSTLEPAKYRVIPTFNDPSNTTITNLQLIVYEHAADRAAPYLLQSRILFDGSDVTLKFDPGEGDLLTSNVLALVLDDDLILPDGRVLPFTKSNISHIQKAYKLHEEGENDFEKEENILSSPSNAHKTKKSDIVSNLFSLNYDPIFIVENTEITLSGEYISEMNLSEGDHLIGAIFDNTEKTTDLRKVILTIPKNENPGETDKPVGPENPEKPGKPVDPENPEKPDKPVDPENPGESDKPVDPEKPGESDTPVDPENPDKPVKPENPDKPNKPNRPNNSGSSNKGSISGNFSGVYKPSHGNTTNTPTLESKQDQNENIPVFTKPDGSYAKNEWVNKNEQWYYVDENGKPKYGWFIDTKTNKWYMLDRKQNGALFHGWYYEEQDGKWYYLDPITGEMLTDWQFIDNKWYYFEQKSLGQTYFGDNINGWIFDKTKDNKPFGSMYENEKTPDGYVVNVDGEWAHDLRSLE